MELKLNCWEVMSCGRGPGGDALKKKICPTALDAASDGINGGKNGGRICWAVAGTFCLDHHQPSVPRKRSLCRLCPFFRRVKEEEGEQFRTITLAPPPGGKAGEPGETSWLRRRFADLEHLLTVCQDITRHSDAGALLRTIARQASIGCDAEHGIVYLLEPGDKQLTAAAMFGQGLVGYDVPIADDSPAGYAAKHDTIVNIFDTSAELSYIFPTLHVRQGFQQQYGFPVRNALAVPIHGRREGSPAGDEEPASPNAVIAVVEVLNSRHDHFSEDDEWFLAQVGVIASLALQSARLSGQVQEMRRVDQAKSRFVGLLMHQIVSPLATAHTCVSTLAKLGDRLSAEDRDSLRRGALAKVVVVQDLAKKLAELMAIRDGRALADCTAVDIVAVLREEAESHRKAAEAENLRLRVELPAGSPGIHADPAGLRIIFANLIENAIKYSGGNGDLVISGGVENGSFFASVRDHGPGIADKDSVRVFDEFFRGAQAVRKGVPGSGLGLAFVKALVTRYGGSVHMESRAGQGCTFTVSFPCI
ncbi:MAG: two-CW domain-containing protein [Candidatus Brocadiia bacterium]